MNIPISFRSAEILTQSLCMTITDSVVEAGSDAEVTLEKIRQASTFAHELARFLDNLSAGIQGVEPDFGGTATITPICRVSGREGA